MAGSRADFLIKDERLLFVLGSQFPFPFRHDEIINDFFRDFILYKCGQFYAKTSLKKKNNQIARVLRNDLLGSIINKLI